MSAPPAQLGETPCLGDDTSPAAWLARADDHPQRLLDSWEWQPGQLALLPVGRAWELVVMRDDLGRRILDVINPERKPGAPVLRDACAEKMYFFTPTGATHDLLPRAAQVLSSGHWVPVPHPSHDGNSYSHWVVRPDGSGRLHLPRPLLSAMSHVYPSYLREIEEQVGPALRLLAEMGRNW